MGVYLEAAKSLAEGKGEYSCLAVMRAGGWRRYREMMSLRDAYADIFFPPGNRRTLKHEAWGNYWSRSADGRRECRVLALCLMAAIAGEEA